MRHTLDDQTGRKAGSTVSLERSSFEALSVWILEMGMSKHAVLSKLVDWFLSQPEIVRTAILRQMPAEMADYHAKMLHDLAERAKARQRR